MFNDLNAKGTQVTVKIMNILITGVAGFIGSHIAERCIAEGHVVYGLDNFDPFYDPARKRSNIHSLTGHSAFRFIEGDIQDPEDVAHVFRAAESQNRSIDVVVHFAAKAGVRPSIEDPLSYTRVNVFGTVNVLEAMVATNTRDLVFASSSSVYGNTQTVPFREDAFVDHPVSPYAATKKSCELLAHSYAHIHGLRIAVLRLFTVYGPRQRPDLAIAKFSSLIEQNQPLPIYGDGTTTRDYTYISDTVRWGDGRHRLVAPAAGVERIRCLTSVVTNKRGLTSWLRRWSSRGTRV